MNLKYNSIVIKSAYLILLVFLFSCSKSNKSPHPQSIHIGIPSNITTLNPMYAMNINEGQLLEQIFTGLVGFQWNDKINNLSPFPMIAESWNWSDDSTAVTFKLRENLLWSDSTKITIDDVLFSYKIYSDRDAQSRFYGSFDIFNLNDDLSINLKKSFEKISDSEIKIIFKEKNPNNLIYMDVPILPKHYYGQIDRKELINSEINLKPIGSGAFKLKSIEKSQAVIIEKNNLSFLASKTRINKIVYRIIPNYNSAMLQLKTGEIDFYEEVKPEDADEFKLIDNLQVSTVDGRAYDFIEWNNIDPNSIDKTEPHPLFGNPDIRKALYLAIDNETIVKQFLGDYGDVAITPVSPIFGYKPIDSSIKSYDKDESKKLLKNAGWEDTNSDGILDKDDKNFSFAISIPSGNLLRKHAAEVVKNNLKAVGIEAEIKSIEHNVFFDKMFNKELDAALAGWSVGIPLEITPYWHSNPELGWGNSSSYNNPKVDKIGERLAKSLSHEEKIELVDQFNYEMINNPPVAFLYWQNIVVVYNKRIKNVTVDPYGALQHIWKWEIEN